MYERCSGRNGGVEATHTSFTNEAPGARGAEAATTEKRTNYDSGDDDLKDDLKERQRLQESLCDCDYVREIRQKLMK